MAEVSARSSANTCSDIHLGRGGREGGRERVSSIACRTMMTAQRHTGEGPCYMEEVSHSQTTPSQTTHSQTTDLQTTHSQTTHKLIHPLPHPPTSSAPRTACGRAPRWQLGLRMPSIRSPQRRGRWQGRSRDGGFRGTAGEAGKGRGRGAVGEGVGEGLVLLRRLRGEGRGRGAVGKGVGEVLVKERQGIPVRERGGEAGRRDSHHENGEQRREATSQEQGR